LFFDERFKFIEEGSTTLRVSQAGGSNASLTLPNIKAPKNGYAHVYVSNESDEMVYFDNLQVAHNRGRIIEENHYYAFGLKIAGISSRKLGDFNEGLLDNKNLYNDKELIDEGDLNWYDYGFRNYDPQTGRFPQLDPLTDDYPNYTPYQFAGNEPIANIDIDGLEPGSSITVGIIGDAATSGTYNVIARAAPRVASAGASIGTKLVTSIAVNAAKITSKVVEKTSEQWGILKWNASNRWDNFKQAALEHLEKVKTNLTPGSDYWKMWGRIGKSQLEILKDPIQAISGPLGMDIKEMEALYEAYQVGKESEAGAEAAASMYKDITIKGAERALRKGKELNKLLDISPNEFANNLGVKLKQNGSVWEAEKNGVRYIMRNVAKDWKNGATVDIYIGGKQLFKYRFNTFFKP